MAVAFTKPWDASVEKNVRDFYHTLSEKDRRALRRCKRGS